MTAMATETRPIAAGDRVRFVGTIAGRPVGRGHEAYVGQTGTVRVVRSQHAGEYAMLDVELDAEGPGVAAPDQMTGTGWYAGRWERITEGETTPEAPLAVGDRVQIAPNASTTEVAGRGYVDTRFHGTVGRIRSLRDAGHAGCVEVELPDRPGHSNFINRVWLTRLDPDLTVADPLGVGAVVETTLYGPGTIVDHRPLMRPSHEGHRGRLEMHSSDPRAYRAVQIAGRHGGYFGEGVFILSAPELRVITPPPPAVVRDPGAFHVGMRVVLASQEVSDARDCHNDGAPTRYAYMGAGEITSIGATAYAGGDLERRLVTVRHDNGETTTWFAGNLDPEGMTPAAPVAAREVVNSDQYPPGTRVMYTRYVGTVLDKAEVPPAIRQAMYDRSGDYVAVRWDRPDIMGAVSYVSTVGRHFVVVPDTSGLTVEQQLLRLQRLIHRVASYEAVRREWCDEVNGALAPLGLPAHLSTVDRDLGRALSRRPDQLLVLDGEIETARTPESPAVGSDEDGDLDDDDDEPVRRDFSVEIQVSYDAEAGFAVRGATVTVNVYTDDYSEDYEIDSGEIRDLVEHQLGERGIVRVIDDDSDLPTVSGYSLDEWTVDDFTEQ